MLFTSATLVTTLCFECSVDRAAEDPAQRESRDADQARSPQNRLVSEIRAERRREMMTPAQVSALDPILGTADALPATHNDDVVVDDVITL